MFCPFCGEKLSDDAVFCMSCGQKISESQPSVRSDEGGPSVPGSGNTGSPFTSGSGNIGGAYNANQNSPYGSSFGGGTHSNNPHNPRADLKRTIEIAKAESIAQKSLIFGILSCVCGGVLWTVLAAVFGFMGLPVLKKYNRPQGKAITGIVLGFSGMVFWIIVLIALAGNGMLPF